ncbi:hypothetical protein CLAFUW4_04693 [Fulvia fulva]|uniref:uncharacterized protein n=1 Tax=Passalora fulva TaxID=5499 RepID=UPI0028526883|nr:uncharacterized protein CLAFUR5_20186 [Fulvia fulva]KAK4627311.1 hypothetical protein CLAFUR4_04679 [Fulvia fulva]KAK4627372.1 hypothetical protein CLAFUR0_04683 [Fulvia fulva]WMI38870.1 hypothetical protein CLAFUR5_20186 [Fulvia fulva]WPV14268.1 hypothetical protein CLAFUW4_04693 [Fulvia fulva]WPV28355.1 hypothetical protein CLAFUW7_04687 [Fulvia fulva]
MGTKATFGVQGAVIFASYFLVVAVQLMLRWTEMLKGHVYTAVDHSPAKQNEAM